MFCLPNLNVHISSCFKSLNNVDVSLHTSLIARTCNNLMRKNMILFMEFYHGYKQFHQDKHENDLYGNFSCYFS